MKQYEYHIEDLSNFERVFLRFKDKFNQLGLDGWELINVISRSAAGSAMTTHHAIFKKEIK